VGAEQAGGRALEESLQEAFEGGEGAHRGGRASVRKIRRSWQGTIGSAGGYLGPRGGRTPTVYSRPRG
jgi:hypothetical protein